MNIPLQEVYEPLMQLFSQIESYQKVYDGIQSLDKERAKKQWLIDKIIEHQKKQKILLDEKEQIDAIYRQASLNQDQSNSLINQDQPLDDTFLQAYKILIEQETLQSNLEQYDQDHEGMSPLRTSLLRNTNEIKSLAFSKVNKNLSQNYFQYSQEMISQLYSIMSENPIYRQKILEQIEYSQRQQFVQNFNLISTQLTTTNDIQLQQNIITAFQILVDQMLLQTTNLKNIIRGDEDQLKISLHQIVDEYSLSFLIKLEKAMSQVKDYFQMFEITQKVNQVIKQMSYYQDKKFSFFSLLHKLHQQCDVLLQRTLQIFQHSLQATRFNISVWSSYEPIEEHLAKSIHLLQTIEPPQKQAIIETLYNPIFNLVTQKLQHNEENRSSKIFSLNTLSILNYFYSKAEDHIQKIEDDDSRNQILAFINQQKYKITELIDNLAKKLHIENLEDIIQKIKFDQIQVKKTNLNNDKEFKDLVRKIVISIMRLDTEVNKKDLFFETEFIRDLETRQKVQLGAIDALMIYYEEFYDLLKTFMDKNNIHQNEDDMVHKLIQMFSVTTKEIPRKDNVKIHQPETLRINLMNSIL